MILFVNYVINVSLMIVCIVEKHFVRIVNQIVIEIGVILVVKNVIHASDVIVKQQTTSLVKVVNLNGVIIVNKLVKFFIEIVLITICFVINVTLKKNVSNVGMSININFYLIMLKYQ